MGFVSLAHGPMVPVGHHKHEKNLALKGNYTHSYHVKFLWPESVILM